MLAVPAVKGQVQGSHQDVVDGRAGWARADQVLAELGAEGRVAHAEARSRLLRGQGDPVGAATEEDMPEPGAQHARYAAGNDSGLGRQLQGRQVRTFVGGQDRTQQDHCCRAVEGCVMTADDDPVTATGRRLVALIQQDLHPRRAVEGQVLAEKSPDVRTLPDRGVVGSGPQLPHQLGPPAVRPGQLRAGHGVVFQGRAHSRCQPDGVDGFLDARLELHVHRPTAAFAQGGPFIQRGERAGFHQDSFVSCVVGRVWARCVKAAANTMRARVAAIWASIPKAPRCVSGS